MKSRLSETIIILIISFLVILLTFYGGVCFFITQPVWPIDPEGSQIEVDPLALESHVRYLSETCYPRHYSVPENLDCAADYIHSHFKESDGMASEQVYDVEGHAARNIIVQYGPESGGRLVIGAHYDVYKAYPGANDDASGVAALIELAYLLGDTNLPMTVELVAYTLEEPPFYLTELMGSTVHAASLRERGIDVNLMIALDEIGHYSDEPNSQILPDMKIPGLERHYSTTANFIALLGPTDTWSMVRQIKKAMLRTTDLPVYSFTVPIELEPRVIMGDNHSFVDHGYPGILITDTAFLRTEVRHTEFDTYDLLDYDRMTDVVIGVYHGILDLCTDG